MVFLSKHMLPLIFKQIFAVAEFEDFLEGRPKVLRMFHSDLELDLFSSRVSLK